MDTKTKGNYITLFDIIVLKPKQAKQISLCFWQFYLTLVKRTLSNYNFINKTSYSFIHSFFYSRSLLNSLIQKLYLKNQEKEAAQRQTLKHAYDKHKVKVQDSIKHGLNTLIR